jgi:hypothetical protein
MVTRGCDWWATNAPSNAADGPQGRGNGATVSMLPLERTDTQGIYRRESKYVVVSRAGGRQRKQYADTLTEARAIKLERDAEARALRRGPRCTRSACRGLIAMLARATTACAPPRAASTVACWSTSR